MSLPLTFGSQAKAIWDRTKASPKSTLPLVQSPEISCLWFRGFIANRRELTAFETQPNLSDPDLLLSIYQRHSLDTPAKIAGPCSWVLWDAGQRRLFAVRDRAGAVPLYYKEAGTLLWISDNVEALLAVGRSPLNQASIVAQIFGEPPRSDETFFSEVRAVEPGGYLLASRDRLTTGLYWSAEPRQTLKLQDDASYAEAFREIFSRVLSGYLSGEPAGVTLTSGMDSTTVAAMIRRLNPDLPITAFSWVAPEIPESDEGPATALVAEKLGCPMVPIRADHHWPLREKPPLRPSPASPASYYYTDLWDKTFEAVREHGVSHLFSGVSGDHLFGGNVYSYLDLLLTGRWTRLSRELRLHLGFTRIGARGILRRMILGPLLRSGFRNPNPSPSVPWLNPQYKALRPPSVPVPRGLLPGRRQRLELLRDHLLPQAILLMNEQAEKYGITFLHPLIDHRLIEFAAALPTEQTFSAGVRKVILRRAMRGLLPDAILDRREKIYPNGIAHRGLRERETAKVWALMTNMRAAEMGFVDEARLREEYQRYLDGKTQSTLFWHTLTLEAWLRLYF